MTIISTITAMLAVLSFTGCSKSDGDSSSSNTSTAYPKEASLVTSDASYKLAFKSDKTGISYYLRRLAKEEVSKMPEDFIISSENTSLIFVPIKDGKIVEAPLSDRVALGYKIPEDLLK